MSLSDSAGADEDHILFVFDKSQRPQFKKFSLDDGNIVWGEDWDLVFPVEQLHAGYIA